MQSMETDTSYLVLVDWMFLTSVISWECAQLRSSESCPQEQVSLMVKHLHPEGRLSWFNSSLQPSSMQPLAHHASNGTGERIRRVKLENSGVEIKAA